MLSCRLAKVSMGPHEATQILLGLPRMESRMQDQRPKKLIHHDSGWLAGFPDSPSPNPALV